jgi:maltose-binding protein MalE
MINKAKLAGLAGACVLALGAVAALTSCNKKAADLNIWCPSGDNEVMNTIIANFKAANETYKDKKIAIQANYGEGDTQGALTADLEAGADVICMADDNIRAAVDAECLQPLTDAEVTAAKASDGEAAVNAGGIDGKYYGFPYRGDNAPLMMYDKTIIDDTAKLTLEGVLAACKAKGAKFYWDLANGWYGAEYLWAAGCQQYVAKDSNNKQIVYSNFHSDEGAAAADAMMALFQTYKDTLVISSTAGTIESGFGDKSIGGCMLWNDYTNCHGKNANVSVAKLPTIAIGGVAKQLKCFVGYKHVVVKAGIADTERLALAKAFAAFETNEASQKLRLTQLGYGPSNLKLLAGSEAAALPWASAITEMSKANAVVAQATSVTSAFWDPVKVFNQIIQNSKAGAWGTYDNAKMALKAMVNSTGWGGDADPNHVWTAA